MGTKTGSEGTIKVGTDLVGEVKSWSINVSDEVIDKSVIGTQWRKNAPMNIRGWSGSLEGFFDFADAGQTALVVGTELQLNLYYEGETSSNNYLQGQAVITSMDRSASFDGMLEVTFSFTGNGELSDEVVA